MFVVDPSVQNNVKDDKRSSNGDTSDNKSDTYVLTANWDTGIGTLTSISGYNKFGYDEDCDCDFTGATILNVDLREKYEQFSQEIRLASDTRASSTILSAASSRRATTAIGTVSIFRPIRCWCRSSTCCRRPTARSSPTPGPRARRVSNTDILSAFGQLTYKFNDHFRVTVGGRVTHEKKDGERTLTIEGHDGAA